MFEKQFPRTIKRCPRNDKGWCSAWIRRESHAGKRIGHALRITGRWQHAHRDQVRAAIILNGDAVSLRVARPFESDVLRVRCFAPAMPGAELRRQRTRCIASFALIRL